MNLDIQMTPYPHHTPHYLSNQQSHRLLAYKSPSVQNQSQSFIPTTSSTSLGAKRPRSPSSHIYSSPSNKPSRSTIVSQMHPSKSIKEDIIGFCFLSSLIVFSRISQPRSDLSISSVSTTYTKRSASFRFSAESIGIFSLHDLHDATNSSDESIRFLSKPNVTCTSTTTTSINVKYDFVPTHRT